MTTKIKSGLIADNAIVSAHISSGAISSAHLSSIDTDNVSEGSSNLYFTTARARTSLSVTDSGGDGSLAYDNSTGAITYTGPSAAEVRAHISVTDSGGDGSLAYSNGVITYVGPSASEVRAHLSAGTGVTYSSGAISIGQSVATTASPTFADINVTGNINVTGDLNTVSVADLDVTDQTITLGAGQNEASSGGSGIVVDGSSASLLWDESNDEWDFNKSINVTGNIGVSGTVDGVDIAARDGVLTSTTTTAGAALPKAGGTMTGTLAMGGNVITSVATNNFEIDITGSLAGNIRANSDLYLLSQTGTLNLGAGGTNSQLSIATTGNATFTGTISSGAITTTGTFTGHNINLRNDTAVDGAIIRDISFLTSAAQGTDDRVAIIRASNQGGDGTNRGGKFTFYTRKSNNAGFNSTLVLDKDGNSTFAGTINSGAITSTGTVTATDLLIDTDVIVTDSTNDRVGINKTSPGTTLDVGGSIYFSSILRGTSDGSESSPSIQPGNDGDTGLYRPATNTIGFTTAGSEAMRIDSSGNVQIDGTEIVNNSDKGKINLWNSSSRTYALQMYHSGVFGSIGMTGAQILLLKTDDTQRIRITAPGTMYFYNEAGTTAGFTWDATNSRVGIGTNSPSYTLDVNGSIGIGTTSVGQSLIQMLANSTNGANTIHFGDATSGTASYTGYINYAHDSNSLQFATNGASERLRIDSSGNILIGGTTGQTTGGSGARWINLDTPSSNSYSSGLLYKINGTVKGYHYVENDYMMHQTVAGGGQKFYANAAVAMTLLSNGNLGIGTTDPDNTLHVHKGSSGTVDGNTNAPLTVENSAANYLQMLAPNGQESGILFGNPAHSADSGIVHSDGDNTLAVRVGSNSTKVIFTATGNIVAQSAGQNRIVLGSTGNASNNTSNWMRGNSGYLQFNSASSGYNWEIGGANKMSMNASGDLTTQGIIAVGTGNYASGTVPIIAKSVSSRGTVRIRSDADNAAELFFDVNGGIRWDFSARDSSADYDMLMYPSASPSSLTGVAAHKFRFTQTGHLGIGTNTAARSGLDVDGAVTSSNSDNDLGTHSHSTYASRVGSGRIDVTSGYSGTLASGRKFIFKYNATSWKAYHGRITLSGTGGFASYEFGGYWNNSGGSQTEEMHDALQASCAITTSGQAILVTITIGQTVVHPCLSVEYNQSGGDGAPRMDRAEFFIL